MATCKSTKCGKEFRKEKTWQEFCCSKCRDDWHYQNKKAEKAANGYPTKEEREAALALPKDGFLSKPPEADNEYFATETQLQAAREVLSRMRRA